MKTGPRVGENWIIEQGLKPGDRVVVEGLLTVRPGIRRPSGPLPRKSAAAAAAGEGRN